MAEDSIEDNQNRKGVMSNKKEEQKSNLYPSLSNQEIKSHSKIEDKDKQASKSPSRRPSADKKEGKTTPKSFKEFR